LIGDLTGQRSSARVARVLRKTWDVTQENRPASHLSRLCWAFGRREPATLVASVAADAVKHLSQITCRVGGIAQVAERRAEDDALRRHERNS
jgi:hypothetical protein